MDKNFWNAVQPILAQFARDGLRTVGAGLLTHGYLANGAGVESFVGAGMTLAGLFWGWWMTSGYLQAGALLQKLTASKTHTEAVEKAEALPAATPQAVNSAIVKSVTSVLLVAFALSFLVAGSSAMAQAPKRPQITLPFDPLGLNKPGAQTGDLGYDLLKALDAKLLPDLQYALLLAKATGSNVTAGCYQAWIDMITVQQSTVKDSTGAEIPTPDPHLVTDFERMVELRNALQPDSKFMVACSPVANMVKQDVVRFMGVVISGGAGLAAMVPGL